MLSFQRNDKILEYVNSREICTIDELAEKFRASNVTIHRILNAFQDEGYVEKVRGGVKALVQPQGPEKRFDIRCKRHVLEKKKIAANAMQHIRDASTIFIDSSSTSVYFAREIIEKFQGQITVVTNSPIILYEMLHSPNINVISTGGELQYELNALVGSHALEVTKNMQFSSVFFSVSGVSLERGMTTAQSSLAEMVRTVCDRTDDVNLLVDSSKFSSVAPLVIGDLTMANRIFSDSKLSQDIIGQLGKMGIEVQIA